MVSGLWTDEIYMDVYIYIYGCIYIYMDTFLLNSIYHVFALYCKMELWLIQLPY